MTVGLVWFRKDLRLSDNPAFLASCATHTHLIPLYILDTSLGESQKWWLDASLESLNASLQKKGLSLIFRRGDPFEIVRNLVKTYDVRCVYWGQTYDNSFPKEEALKKFLENQGVDCVVKNTRLLKEPWDVKTQQGGNFKVFGSFFKALRQTVSVLGSEKISSYPSLVKGVYSDKREDWDLGDSAKWSEKFKKYWTPGEAGALKNLELFLKKGLAHYKEGRDFPNQSVISRLSPHLHFGEISVCKIWGRIQELIHTEGDVSDSGQVFLAELGWREFSYHLLHFYPDLPQKNFQKKFDAFPWEKNKRLYTAWQKGQTGYPLVDAGMRELWETGVMHNRVRMVVASFLVKNLLMHWREGAGWFQNTLLDADLACNTVNWQWVAGTGLDAAPYFRIFNPVLQSKKFDARGEYIKRWVPELADLDEKNIHTPWLLPHPPKNYPTPIIPYAESRKKALHVYQGL